MIRGLALAIAIICFPSTAHAQFTCPAHQWVNGSGFGGTTRCAQPTTGDISGFSTGTSGHVLPFLDGINTWSGGNTFSGSVFLGSGKPWVDVKSGANGCAVAVGNNSTNDHDAIICQANYLNSTFGGGVLFFPPGIYRVASTLSMPACILMVGAGSAASSISIGGDITAISWGSNCATEDQGIGHFQLFGNQTGAATQDMMTIAAGVKVRIYNIYTAGGNNAINNAGQDVTVFDSTLFAYGSSGCGFLSSGSAWLIRVKIDQGAVSTLCAIKETVTGGEFELHVEDCDLSGSYTDSLIVSDTNNAAIVTVKGSILSSPVSITSGKYVMMVGDELSANITTSIGLSIVGSLGLSAITASGAGTRSCAGNSNITC